MNRTGEYSLIKKETHGHYQFNTLPFKALYPGNVACNDIFWGITRCNLLRANVAKVELDSARTVARQVSQPQLKQKKK